MATKATSGGAGQRVAARFDGANQSEQALKALQGAGFRADQVEAKVYDPQDAAAATGGGSSAEMVPIVGAVLGAILGGILGRVLVGSTTAIILAALVGAVAGALIARAIARAGTSQAPTTGAAGTRAGAVTLTVMADSAAQAQAARAALKSGGGQEIAAADGR